MAESYLELVITVKRIVTFLLLIVIVAGSIPVQAAKVGTEGSRVLIVYSPKQEEDLGQARMMDSLAGHFSNDIKIIEDQDWRSINPKDFTQIIYMGLEEKQLPGKLVSDIKLFKGTVYAFGRNSEQFGKRFSFVKRTGGVLVNKLKLTSNGFEMQTAEERLASIVTPSAKSKVLVSGMNGSTAEYPLVIQNGNDFYCGLESLFNPSGYFVGESLFSFFGQKPTGKHPMYLRLEDVHPKADAGELMKMAKYLDKRRIPYIVSLIPVYVDPQTHKETHLKDVPKLVRTLRYMQGHGGSIVLHGYRHQYRHQGTGEGFEFWDVDYDRPVYQDNDEKPKTRKDFKSGEAYKSFVQNGKAFERKYIKSAVENGVEELAAHKLYPLAFEAPHYAMSEAGYQILSEHFSTYVGQVQLTNHTWEGEYSAIYTSAPSFLNGMKLYPETIGYVSGDEPNSIAEMKEKAMNATHFSDSAIAGFYHPYLGFEKLKELVTALEGVPNAEWFDLKAEDNRTNVGQIRIQTSEGKVDVEKNSVTSKYERQMMISRWIPKIIVIISAVILFVLLIVRRRRKQL
ncbi:DUF2334 domain-containing protein [Aciduricibacillus chroicocephali]|uniref:DUF2334 domain-containing protein n=1 Tax=Aciduricibacillus chroicocephali TaxID=3054939 RepID=A0ABY9KUF2_9BACI|nr:DUF2334 domain-containing protein [Bacillaceae bacterium 44XB]